MVSFRLGPIPIRIHGSFVLIALLLSMSNMKQPALVVASIVAIFLAVLLHELGHAVVGKLFGLVPQIDLHGMGGTTSWPSGRKLTAGKSIVVSLAGPIAGIVSGVSVLVAVSILGESSRDFVRQGLGYFVFASAGWGVMNLVPMLPLDGGNVMLGVFQLATKGRGERAARIVSIAVAVGVVVLAVSYGHLWPAAIAGLFGFRNFQALSQGKREQAEVVLYEELRLGFAALDRHDGGEAIRRAEPVLSQARSPEVRFDALRLLAYARLLEGQWAALMALLERSGLELGQDELARLENAAAELGRSEEAARIRELRTMPPSVAGFRA